MTIEDEIACLEEELNRVANEISTLDADQNVMYDITNPVFASLRTQMRDLVCQQEQACGDVQTGELLWLGCTTRAQKEAELWIIEGQLQGLLRWWPEAEHTRKLITVLDHLRVTLRRGCTCLI